jgi:hypothetical protein
LQPGRKFKPKKGFRRRFWRLLARNWPEWGRRYLAHLIRQDIFKLAPLSVACPSEPITLVGLFRTHLGIAQTGRILASGLRAAGMDVRLFDCSDIVPHLKTDAIDGETDVPSRGTLVFCINPPELYKLFRRYGPEICRGKRLVGYWWWELDRLPADWRRWAGAMHEIWVSSQFLYEVFSTELPGKTVRLVRLPLPKPTPSKRSQADFGIPSSPFTVLSAFDLQSGWARKNPEGAIEAFRRAFPQPGEAQLVLKASGVSGAPKEAARLRSIIAGMPDVHLIDRFLPAADLSALIGSCSTLLSLHRSEGLGLFIAEAMWLGVPIVATGWSGVLELIDEDHAMLVRFRKVKVRPGDYFWAPRGAMWAEPDIDHAAACLRRLKADVELRAELSHRGIKKAEKQFALDTFCREVRAATGLANQPSE